MKEIQPRRLQFLDIWSDWHVGLMTGCLLIRVTHSFLISNSPTNCRWRISCVHTIVLRTLNYVYQYLKRKNAIFNRMRNGYYMICFTVNRFKYINNIITTNRSLIPLEPNIILGPYKLSLQATIDLHGNSIHCGDYTASVNCCGKKTFYCNDDIITEYNTIDRHRASTV